MAFATFTRKSLQALAMMLMAPALLILAALPALIHPSDLNNGKYERPPLDPGTTVAPPPENLVRLR